MATFVDHVLENKPEIVGHVLRLMREGTHISYMTGPINRVHGTHYELIHIGEIIKAIKKARSNPDEI